MISTGLFRHDGLETQLADPAITLKDGHPVNGFNDGCASNQGTAFVGLGQIFFRMGTVMTPLALAELFTIAGIVDKTALASYTARGIYLRTVRFFPSTDGGIHDGAMGFAIRIGAGKGLLPKGVIGMIAFFRVLGSAFANGAGFLGMFVAVALFNKASLWTLLSVERILPGIDTGLTCGRAIVRMIVFSPFAKGIQGFFKTASTADIWCPMMPPIRQKDEWSGPQENWLSRLNER